MSLGEMVRGYYGPSTKRIEEMAPLGKIDFGKLLISEMSWDLLLECPAI